ncbi:MAG: TIGR01906 family membrane protein [Anaerolineae bacterium]|nr:TIGR01906 family membrane protein [Anaerolineae bacterium]
MNTLYRIFCWIIALIIPFFLLISATRLLMVPAFLEHEYNQADFPADPYGFSTAERLQYSRLAVEYLINSADISFLGNQTFADGKALYQPQELSHMEDVKGVVQAAFLAWYFLFAIILAGGIWGWQRHWFSTYLGALSKGGWLTLALIAAALVGVFSDFSELFTHFHQIFFKDGTWTFLFSDTLIRLFPLQFWMDAFIFAGVFAFIGGLLLAFGGAYFSKRVD